MKIEKEDMILLCFDLKLCTEMSINHIHLLMITLIMYSYLSNLISVTVLNKVYELRPLIWFGSSSVNYDGCDVLWQSSSY